MPPASRTNIRVPQTGADLAASGKCNASDCDSVSLGRSLPTCVADKMSLESAEAGACGTMIFWKHVGHSSCLPLALESAVICCPQTGQANLNSLIAYARNHSIP